MNRYDRADASFVSAGEPMPEVSRPLPAQQATGIPATVAPVTVDSGGRSFSSVQGDHESWARAPRAYPGQGCFFPG